MKTVKRTIRAAGAVTELAGDDVPAHIGRDRYASIKRRDEHPMFVVLTVGYEGLSYGRLTVEGKGEFQAKRWHRGAIEELGERLNWGAATVYTDTHDGKERPRRGDVVSGFTVSAEDRQVAKAVAYIGKDEGTRERIRRGELTACSIEADIVVALGDEEPFVESVDAVTGVVLADPKKETPGFVGAGVEAVIAELRHNDERGRTEEMGEEGVKDKKPGQLFTRNELAEDPVVKALVDAGRESVYQDLQRTKGELTAVTAKLTDAEAKLKAAGASVNAASIAQKVEAAVGALKITAEEKAEIRLRLTSLVADPTASDADLTKLVDGAVTREAESIERVRKLYGGKPPAAGKQPPPDRDTTGDAGRGKDGEEGDGDDFLKENALAKA